MRNFLLVIIAASFLASGCAHHSGQPRYGSATDSAAKSLVGYGLAVVLFFVAMDQMGSDDRR